MTKLVVPDKESNSVQRPIKAVKLIIEPGNDFTSSPDLITFRTNRSDSKVVLTALWDRHPVDVRTNLPTTSEELADQLESDSIPHVTTIKLVPDSAKGAGSIVNRLISFIDRQEFIAYVDIETGLPSLLLNEQMLNTFQKNRREDFLRPRSTVPRRYFVDFLSARTAYGHEDTPPLEE